TAKSSFVAKISPPATGNPACCNPPPTPNGCTPATSANSTPKVISTSAAARKTSSSLQPASTFIPKISKPPCAVSFKSVTPSSSPSTTPATPNLAPSCSQHRPCPLPVAAQHAAPHLGKMPTSSNHPAHFSAQIPMKAKKKPP